MLMPQKSQCPLRGVLGLARQHGDKLVKIADIVEGQAISPRFLEIILRELKLAGFVESRGGGRLPPRPLS